MADFNIRSDSVNVEQIMEQIRSRIREKRGVDYTEQQIRDLAAVKLEKFLDPRGVRSDLLEQFRKAQPPDEPLELPNYSFESATLFDSHRAIVRFIRRLLLPILKLFFNPNPLIQALHIQAQLNTIHAGHETAHRASHHLFYELIHNLVVETTRLAIEVKNLKMRVESLSGRLEFNERRARALESVVVYKGDANDVADRDVTSKAETAGPLPPLEPRPLPQAGSHMPSGEGPGQRSRRRRRRRGRRTGPGAAVMMSGQASAAAAGSDAPESASASDSPARDDFKNVSGAAAHRLEPVTAERSTDSSQPLQPAPVEPSDRSSPDTPAATSSDAGPSIGSDPGDTNSQ